MQYILHSFTLTVDRASARPSSVESDIPVDVGLIRYTEEDILCRRDARILRSTQLVYDKVDATNTSGKSKISAIQQYASRFPRQCTAPVATEREKYLKDRSSALAERKAKGTYENNFPCFNKNRGGSDRGS